MTEKKPCVLEGAVPGAAHDGREHAQADVASHAACALLCPLTPSAAPATATPAAPLEDESADPVGDGHSDADWAAEHPRGSA